jgi:hypothetical protein
MPQLETLFAAEVFDPATAEEHYRLAATDYALLLFLHQVAREVNKLRAAVPLRSPFRKQAERVPAAGVGLWRARRGPHR